MTLAAGHLVKFYSDVYKIALFGNALVVEDNNGGLDIGVWSMRPSITLDSWYQWKTKKKKGVTANPKVVELKTGVLFDWGVLKENRIESKE